MFKEAFERYVYRSKSAAEQVLLDDKKESHNLTKQELMKKMWTGKSKYERFVSLLRLIKDILPKSLTNIDESKLKDLFYYKKDLPFNPKKYNFGERIGIGGQSRVYLLESQTKENCSWTIKIATPNIEGKTPLEQVEAFKKEYEYIKKIYKEMPELIPLEHFLMIDDPYHRSKFAAATILQPFVSGEIRDIFDVKPEELKNMSQKNSFFKEQLEKFCSTTLDYAQENGEVIDLLGPKNVSVVKSEEGERLVLLDPHLIYSTPGPEKEQQEQIDQALEFLKKVGEELKE